jgi:hypothetical protein
VVGFHAGGGKVNKISSVNHNFPPHVVHAAQVGTISVRAWYFNRQNVAFFVYGGRSKTYKFFGYLVLLVCR